MCACFVCSHSYVCTFVHLQFALKSYTKSTRSLFFLWRVCECEQRITCEICSHALRVDVISLSRSLSSSFEPRVVLLSIASLFLCLFFFYSVSVCPDNHARHWHYHHHHHHRVECSAIVRSQLVSFYWIFIPSFTVYLFVYVFNVCNASDIALHTQKVCLPWYEYE